MTTRNSNDAEKNAENPRPDAITRAAFWAAALFVLVITAIGLYELGAWLFSNEDVVTGIAVGFTVAVTGMVLASLDQMGMRR